MLCLGSGASVLALAVPWAAHGEPAVGQKCKVDGLKIAALTGFQFTNKSSLQKVFGTRIKFTQGGNKPGCVIITFSGEVGANGTSHMNMTAGLDPANGFPITRRCAPGSGPVSIVLHDDSPVTALAAHSMEWLCTDVPPGDHETRLEYQSIGGDNVTVGSFTLTVRYAE